MTDGRTAERAEDRSTAQRGAAGGRRSTHLTVKSSTGRAGKSEENRRNAGQWLVPLLCLSVISLEFTWPAAYLSLERGEKGMERLREKPPLSTEFGDLSRFGTSLQSRTPPRPFAVRNWKGASHVNAEAAKWKFATRALGSWSKHSKAALVPLLADLDTVGSCALVFYRHTPRTAGLLLRNL